MTNTTVTIPDRTNYQILRDSSPYYLQIVSRWGRWLTYAQVRAILEDHSLTIADYVADGNESPSADANTDAADLLVWLGY